MIRNIYYKDVIVNGADIVEPYPTEPLAIDGKKIKFKSTAQTIQDAEIKVIMLFYNRLSKNGEIKSSIVYYAEEAPADSNYHTYNINTLYNHNAIEYGWTTQRFDPSIFLTTFAQLDDPEGLSNLKPTHPIYLGNCIYNDEDLHNGVISTVPSKESRYFVYDGWYSLVEYILTDETNGGLDHAQTVPAGILRYDGTKVQYANINNPLLIDDWTDVTTASDLVSIATMLYGPWVTNTQFLRRDFFILYKFFALYDQTIDKFLNKKYAENTLFIKGKYRSIDINANNDKFADAQYELQSTDFARLTL